MIILQIVNYKLQLNSLCKKHEICQHYYWPFSKDDDEKTMSPKVTRTPLIGAIKDDQNIVYDER